MPLSKPKQPNYKKNYGGLVSVVSDLLICAKFQTY